VKEALITKLGWPVAHPKLTSRLGQHDQPFAVRKDDSSSCGFTSPQP